MWHKKEKKKKRKGHKGHVTTHFSTHLILLERSRRDNSNHTLVQDHLTRL